MMGKVPPPLPYRWHPLGARDVHEPPPVGSLVAWRHAVWRVVEVTDVAEVDWTDGDRRALAPLKAEFRPRAFPRVVVIRPVGVVGDDPRARDRDVHLGMGGERRWRFELPVYPNDHYPVCARCAEPLPCRDQMAAELSGKAAKRMGRFELAGVCPDCEEPVTARQKSITFDVNVEVLGGPPVTFHMRRGCGGAYEYERRTLAADPTATRRLTCPGHVVNHNDGTYECSEFGLCPGPRARHQAYTTCRCPDCHARGTFGCSPSKDAVLLDRRDAS